LRTNEPYISIYGVFLLIALVCFAICSFACSSISRPDSEAPAASSGQTTIFGDELSLTGSYVTTRDGHSEVELRWKALRKPAANYFAFVHAVGGSSGIAFQLDHVLKNAAGAPTSSWAPEETVSDRFLAVPPAGQSPGAYTLRIGVYVPQPMRILRVAQAALPEPEDSWKGQAVLLEHIDCK
jgi:hypothetical protein